MPAAIAALPAVVALRRNDPAAFRRFQRLYADSAVKNAKDDEVLSLARAALRKSVKRQLANSPGDTLLEMTETYLVYMRGLESLSPESCVALSDESKGARMTSNLAQQFPFQFIRDMAVLERVSSVSLGTAVMPLTADQARPFLELVFSNVRQQPVKSELLGRDKLSPAEFEPYCALMIAFYQAVLELPRNDKINLLRYLYATAAAEPGAARSPPPASKSVAVETAQIRGAPAAPPGPPPADRALDCRNPQDAPQCAELGPTGRLAGPPPLRYTTRTLSFNEATRCANVYRTIVPDLRAGITGAMVGITGMIETAIVCPSTPIYQRPDGTFGTGTATEIAEEKAQYERFNLKREAEEAAERRRREAQEQAAAAEAEKKRRAQISAQIETERNRGYERISFETFQLDGRRLAASEAKVSIQGYYQKIGQIETLSPSDMAALNPTVRDELNIGLLTDDAPRNIRKYFLDCRTTSKLGCRIVIWGRATMCTTTTLVGSKNSPCLIVEDGWN
jgi:hypothetical protein